MDNRDRLLSVAVLAYATSSLFHHIHNAEFLGEYPNMPVWLSRAWVYAAWCSVTAVGASGVALLWKRRRVLGLWVLGAYGGFGLYGLAHYVVAPVSAHTVAANISIWLEVVSALLLLGLVATSIYGEWTMVTSAARPDEQLQPMPTSSSRIGGLRVRVRG